MSYSTGRRNSLDAERLSYAADFETTTDVIDGVEHARVWAWGLSIIDGEFPMEYDNSIDTFIERISMQHGIVYFHNLRFDGSFILSWLMTHGFRHKTKDTWNNAPGTFQTLISDMGQWYSITVVWETGYKTEFRDSHKKIPLSAENIAISFNLDIKKGKLDYDAPRPVGHKITVDELEYLENDVMIIAQAMRQVLNSGMKKLTVASDSMAEYKRLVPAKIYANHFPVLNTEMDAEIRRAYRGGFTYADPRFTGRILRSGLVLDVNSLYPSVMRSRLLPYGVPEYVDGKVDPTPSRPLTVFSITFTAKLKKDHIPCIQVKSSHIFSETEYLTEITEPTTLMMTNVDFDLYNDHYDMNIIEYGGGWRFKAADGMFNDYIDKWAKVKENSTGGAREIAKLHLNSLYGKFASNPNMRSKIPVLVDGVVKLVNGEPETRDPIYTAVGVFVTAYAREKTIRSAQENYTTFCYADTDSLHLLQDNVPDNLDIDDKRMGAWALEYRFEAAYIIRPKQYLERKHDGTYKNAIAGMPVNVSGSLTFDDLKDGTRVFDGKLQQKVVAGGVVLENKPFKLQL